MCLPLCPPSGFICVHKVCPATQLPADCIRSQYWLRIRFLLTIMLTEASVKYVAVWYYVCKVIQKNQLDATIICWSTRSAQHVSGNLLPVFRSVRLRFLQHVVCRCCGGQEFGERQRGTTCTVWRKLTGFLKKPVKQLPSYSIRSATLPLSEPLPTTTTGYHML